MPGAWKVSEAASIALHSAAFLAAHEGETFTAGEIADRLKVSKAHVQKVLGQLERSDILKAVRGPNGGFSLSKPSGEISLMMIFEAIEGPYQLKTCLMVTPCCKPGRCILDGLPASVDRQIKIFMESKRLSEVSQTYGDRNGERHEEPQKNHSN